jgi:hypothetical protein
MKIKFKINNKITTSRGKIMPNDSDQNKINSIPIQEKIIVSDPKLIRIILHEQKLLILNEILREMKNIQELKEMTGLNPGTVKRNLDELIENQLVQIVAIKKSDYNITMKYYQAVAKEFEIHFTLSNNH